MAEPIKVFRRFDSWPEAQAYAIGQRKATTVQVIFSEHRPDADFQRIEGQSYGPWVVEDYDGGFIRNWEVRVAHYPKVGSGHRMKVFQDKIKWLIERPS